MESAAWYCCHILPPATNLPAVLLTPVASCHRYQQYKGNWWQNLRRCRWHRWQICRCCCWYRWCTLGCEYLREFSKKFETVLMGYSGAWGKQTHEKNQKQKISWHCLFNVCKIQSTYDFVKGIAYRKFSGSPAPRHIPPGSPDHFLLKITRKY